MCRTRIGTLALGLGLELAAQTPDVIHVQGRLIDGSVLSSGPAGLSLSLFDAETGGTRLYEDSNTVMVTDGLYETWLGDQTVNGDLGAALDATNVWMETRVNGVTLTPRARLGSVAYAQRAARLDGPLQIDGVSVGIGTDQVASSALLELQSTNQGMLVSRMTHAQRIAITNPAPGLLVYQTDDAVVGRGFYYYGTSNWAALVQQSALPYTDTELVSLVQDNGIPYFRASLSGQTIANGLLVPGRSLTYIALTYFTSGFPSVGVSLTTSPGSITNAYFALTNSATDPTIVEYILPTPMTTALPRAFELKINGLLGGSSYVNVRSVVIGYRPTPP